MAEKMSAAKKFVQDLKAIPKGTNADASALLQRISAPDVKGKNNNPVPLELYAQNKKHVGFSPSTKK